MIEQAEINHAKLFYSELCRLVNVSDYYESAVISLFDEFTYVKQEESNIFSESTSKLFSEVLKEIRRYYSSVNYSSDPILKLLDVKYLQIIENDVLPLIKSVKEDLKSHKIKIEELKEKLEIQRPSSLEILNRVEILYGLLLKHNIVDKSHFK